jgi:hypothetical protein
MERNRRIGVMARHIINTLPDSIDQRRVLLFALLDVLPQKHELRSHVTAMAKTLEHHITLQKTHGQTPSQH